MVNFDFGIHAGIIGASQFVSDVDKMKGHSDAAFGGIEKGAKKAGSSLEQLSHAFPGLGQAIEFVKNPIFLLTAAFAALTLAFATVVGSAQEFNNEFLQIQNLNIDKTSEQIDGLQDSILNASLATGKAAKDMSRAFFDIQSGTGLFGDKVDQIARKVADFSTATKIDFNTAIGASIKAIRAFKLDVEDLDGFLASSFATVQLGIVTFDQLAKVQTDFAGSAAGAGQSVDTANKIFAGFTATAKSAEEAATLTKTAFQDLGKKQTIDGLASIGVKMYDASGAIRDTTDVVADLVPLFKSMSQQKFDALLAEMGGSEGLRGLMLQVRNEGEGLIKVFQDFDKAKGNFDMEKLLANAKGDFSTLRDIVGNQLNTVFTMIGMKVLPTLARALNEVTKLLPVMWKFVTDNATALKALGIAAGIVAGGILLAKGAMLASNLVTVISTAVTALYEATIITLQASYIALTGSTTLAAGAMKAFQILMASNPYTLAIAAVAALAVGIYLLTQRTVELTDKQKLNAELSAKVGEAFGAQAAESTLLFDKLRSLDSKSDEYKSTLALINEQYGEYLPNLLTNKSSLDEIAAAQQLVNDGLLASIRLKIKEQKLTELTSEFLGKSMPMQLEVAKAAGLSVAETDRVLRELAKTTKGVSKEQAQATLSTVASTIGFKAYLEQIAHTPGVSEEASAALLKVAKAGNSSSLAMVDLALGTGNYQRSIEDVNAFFDANDPLGNLADKGKKASDGLDGVGDAGKKAADKLAVLKAAINPSVGSIALYELELSKLEEKFKQTGDSMERARLAERIAAIRAEIELMKGTKAGTVDPLDELAGMGATNIEDKFAQVPQFSDLDAKLEGINQKFKDIAKTVKGELTQAFGEAIFTFGKVIGAGGTAGDAAKAALLGLADVVLSQVPKYIGLFLLETAVGLGFPAGLPFLLAGIGLLAFSGIAAGLLQRAGGNGAAQQQAAVTASSAVPTASAGLATPSASGLSDFNAQNFDQNRQTIKIYLGGKEVSDLIRRDLANELDLQGG